MKLGQKIRWALVSGLILSQPVQASLLVEQYSDYWSANVNDLEAYADANIADASVYFDVIDFTDDPAGFAGEIPGSNRWPVAEALDVDGESHPVNDTFFASVSGMFEVYSDGDYFFKTWSDDGVFVFIDGNLIINDPNLHEEQMRLGDIFLSAGTHEVQLYYFENGGEASLEFTVADASMVFQHWGNSNVIGLPATPPVVNAPEPSTLAVLAMGLFGLIRRAKYK